MTEAAHLALALTGGALAGLAVGVAYFALLQRSIAGYVGEGPLRIPLLLTALRLGLAAAAFWLLVQWSAAAAIGGLLGFTLECFGVRPKIGLD